MKIGYSDSIMWQFTSSGRLKGYVGDLDLNVFFGDEADFKKLGEVIAQMGDILYRHGSRLAESRDSIRNAAATAAGSLAEQIADRRRIEPALWAVAP